MINILAVAELWRSRLTVAMLWRSRGCSLIKKMFKTCPAQGCGANLMGVVESSVRAIYAKPIILFFSPGFYRERHT